MRRVLRGFGLLTAVFSMSCATIGREFPVEAIHQIVLGETTKEDITRMFGHPWRTGIEDGNVTWTYGHYRYSMFGSAKTRDLVVRFNDQNIVVSYTFNTTEHEEGKPP